MISSRTASDLDAVLAGIADAGGALGRRGGRRRLRPRRRAPPGARGARAIRPDRHPGQQRRRIGRHGARPVHRRRRHLRGHAHPEPHLGLVDDPCGASRDARAASTAASSASARAHPNVPRHRWRTPPPSTALVGFTRQLARATGTDGHHGQPAVPRVDEHVAARARRPDAGPGPRPTTCNDACSNRRSWPGWRRSSRPTRAPASPARSSASTAGTASEWTTRKLRAR